MGEIERLPGMYLHEYVEKMNYGGSGDVPCFIGKTNNIDADGSKIYKFNSFNDASKSVKDGGIGATGYVDEDLKTNPLENVIKRFFNESEITSTVSEDVPYIYCVDVGTGETLSSWNNSLEVSKLPHDINIEAYYGIEYLKKDMQKFINNMNASLTTKAKAFDFRYGFITLTEDLSNESGFITDTTMKALAQANKDFNRCYVFDSQIKDPEANSLETRAVDQYIFGDIVARFSVTPLGQEPGYYEFNTIPTGTFCKRTDEEATSLQGAGVVFGRDELWDDTLHARINLAIATSYGNTYNSRPADCFYYARRICDDTLMEIYNKCYPSIKAIETDRNLEILQTRVNTIINDRVNKGLLKSYDAEKNPNGSRLSILESNTEPFEMVLKGKLQAVGMIKSIDVEDTITAPSLQETEAD